MAEEPENLILRLLREVRAETATKADVARLDEKIGELRAHVAADLHRLDAKIEATRKELNEQIVGLRRAVVEYHSTTLAMGY